jgi:hypothetical protein
MKTLIEQMALEQMNRQQHLSLMQTAANTRRINSLNLRRDIRQPLQAEPRPALRLKWAYVMAVVLFALSLATQIAIAAANAISASGGGGLHFLVR